MWTDCLLMVAFTSVLVSSSSLTDVALKKPAVQSSTYNTIPTAEKVVDGNRGTCQHTLKSNLAGCQWWYVDLQGYYEISSVEITNRVACCLNTLADAHIEVFLLRPKTCYPEKVYNCRWPVGPIKVNETKHLQCYQPIVGRYVRVSMYKSGSFLNFCDAKVFARVPAFASRLYVRTKGRKAEGVMLREMTSRNVVECLGWCNADPACSAVNIRVPTWTAKGWSHVCQLLAFGGVGQPDTTVPDPDWDFHGVGDVQTSIV
ncbi:fucolectin-7-like [Babylonia areolata]|uniref:fucolectin-7-like n=1 Tax=Babylonia areolata TaxID=304850 RepID=UPI003FD64BDC